MGTLNDLNNSKREIEVKAKVRNIESLKSKLEELGCSFNSPIKQKDSIFITQDNTFPVIKPGTSVLRLREQNGRTIFTLKQPKSNELDKLELETEVTDYDTMQQILITMGYRLVVEVNKIREKSKLGEYEFCIDKVEGLGTFVEVEKISSEDGIRVQNELMKLLISAGIKEEDRVIHGYDTLIYKKKSEKS